MRWIVPCLLLAGCQKTPAEPAAPPAAPSPATEPAVTESNAPAETIGQARMEDDGTIVLQLRAAGPGALGDAVLRYPPSHAEYQAILDHLGGLKPGESKPVPPFPD